MESILDLLTEKNHFLEKFMSLNEQEIVNFSEGNFKNLDGFYNSRERVLSILAQIDKKIEEESLFDFEDEMPTPVEKKNVITFLDYKTELVTKILAQDLQILSFIEEEKSNIIKELSTVKSSRKVIGSYKSNAPVISRVDEKV